MSQIYDTFNQEPGWQSLGINQVAEFTAINVTDGPTPTIQTMAVHGKVAAAMYNEQSTTSKHNWARYSSGWDATLKVPGLLLETECLSVNGSAVGSWTVAANENATISVEIGPYTSNSSFEGVQCLISIENAQISLQQWLYDGTGDYSYSITNWGQGMNAGIWKLGSSEDDFSMATEGTDWFQDFLPNLQNLSSAPQIVNLTSLIITIADSLMTLNRGYSETLAISAVVGAIFADMFTSFEWTYTDIPGNTTYQGPIRWQIYGSGPRLPWEWTIATVLGIVVMIHVYDLGLLLRYNGLAQGYWLSLNGMMRTANLSSQINETSDAQNAETPAQYSEPTRLFAREIRDSEGQTTGKVVVVDQETLNSQRGPGEKQYVELRDDREYSKKDQ
ncbi:hypothetical protein N7448_006017 [Penicillium atrosanguineum]|uniref:Uncharacterized protein n=1 Tax=Penicillium atrosanguineum TaxID=1132637 RepID=A0A9W9PTZ4_9EURO|nr:uncharacterized protein N7443_009782 [Penicillium atrosanguineum]KAJ5131859.1 hypothetical protein N7448_006017 [Penicillium atrosanguineum]KAJ5137932.1 hypothetical protein N7526_004165 [Penicillium atrosanguineum]KAJ5289529.1 hypothetical protein N7443_009782 [Penicillium atrosanguineum]KAJ5307344.1 hypothetical protein N7476_008000 [Penicillium atrosanguineum]